MSQRSGGLVVVVLIILLVVGCSNQTDELKSIQGQEVKLKVNLQKTKEGGQSLEKNNLQTFKVQVCNFATEKVISSQSGIKLNDAAITTVVFGNNVIKPGVKYKILITANNNNLVKKSTPKISCGITTVEIDLTTNSLQTQSIPGALRPSGVKVANQDGNDKGKIAVSWEVKDAVGPYPFQQDYVIYRSQTKERPIEPLVSRLEKGFYLDSNVKIGQTYYYWVAGQDPTNKDYISRPVGPFKITARKDTPYFEDLNNGQFRLTFYPSKYNLYQSNLPVDTKVYLAGQMNNWGRPKGCLDQDKISSKYMNQLQEVGNVWSVQIDLSKELNSTASYLEYKWYVDYGNKVVWYGFDGDSIKDYPYPIGDGNPNTYEHDLYLKLKENAPHPVFWWREW